MADGLLGLLGGGNTGDLSQLIQRPDPLSDALAAMSERFAKAGEASRLPTSTLGALGSALGGAATAARTSQGQYLDQAIKLQKLKQSLMQMGYDQRTAEFVARKMALSEAQRPAQPGATPAITPMPGAPIAAPTTAPAATLATPSIAAPPAAAGGGGYDPLTGNPLDASPAPAALPLGGSPMQLTGLLSPDTVLPTQGGAGAATTLASFRPASLVEPNGRGGDGAGIGADPLDLIAKYESGGRNIQQQVVPESVSSASGPWQMLNSTFRETAAKHNIDIGDAKRAMDAPEATQRAVAQALYNDKGYAPWAPYNPRLAAAIGGGATATPRGLLASGERRDDGGGSDAALSGLLALAGGDEDPLAGLLAGDKGAVQPGPPDELIPSDNALPTGLFQRAAMTAPGRTEPAQTTPIDQASPENLDLTARVAQSRPPLALPGVPGMPQSLDEIARGASGRPGMMLAQYAPGGGVPATTAPAAPPGGIPPLVGPGSGMIPGLGMTPQDVALVNAMSILAGHANSPFKEFLDIYYKSPEYLQQAAQASEWGKSAVATPATIAINEAQAMNTIRTQMANEGLMIDPKTNQVVQIPGWAGAKARTADELEAVKNKYATKLAETQAGFEPVTVNILQPDGSQIKTTITKAELKRREDMRGSRQPQPGDIVGEPVETPGSKFGQSLAEDSYKTAQTAKQSLEQNNRVLKLLDGGIIAGTGANTALALEKLGAALGYTGHDRVARTEAFVAAMGSEVANVIKQGKFGPPTSNVDIDFANAIAGGKITLDEQSIRRIAAMREEVNRRFIDQHNKDYAPILSAPGSKFKATIDPPMRYGSHVVRNRDTGKRQWYDETTSQWRPLED